MILSWKSAIFRDHALASAIAGAIAVFLCLFSFPVSAKAEQRLVIEMGKAVRLEGVQKAESIFVADPEIADLSTSPQQTQYVYGKKPGETTIIATDRDGNTLRSIDLIVTYNLSEIRRAIQQNYPSQSVTLHSAPGSIRVSGRVKDEFTHQGIIAILNGSAPNTTVIDEIAVQKLNLIRLDVKLIELGPGPYPSRLNWTDLITSLGNGRPVSGRSASQLNSIVDYLLLRGDAWIVASSTLTAADNKKAEFSSGNGSVTVNVALQPQFYPGGRVSLDVTSDFFPAGTTIASSEGASSGASQHFTSTYELFNGRSMAVSGVSAGMGHGLIVVVTPLLAGQTRSAPAVKVRRQTNRKHSPRPKSPCAPKKVVQKQCPAGSHS
ncbi:pilus assembly protein N-terminal domain-containing protein [Brucella sp. IR073]|uniref:pilus assembly protein N-terminal domain-containing protein n=1 Tax=unclassified Brucella TaxID=2632610 RepID=UPI003B97E8C6